MIIKHEVWIPFLTSAIYNERVFRTLLIPNRSGAGPSENSIVCYGIGGPFSTFSSMIHYFNNGDFP